MPAARLTLQSTSRFNNLLRMLPGLALGGLLALGANVLAAQPWFKTHGIGTLTVAIVFGIVAGNTFYARVAVHCAPGVGFAKMTLLRLGIVLYGFRISLQDLEQLGWSGLAIDAGVLGSTFVLAAWAGPRLFGMERGTSMLIGAGSAICGAAAVLATAPVLRAKSAEVAVAISTVVLFGTLTIFLYPALYHSVGEFLGLSPRAYGLFVGSTVHEVAQVVAAGQAISAEAADVAVVAKMARVMMLAPFLLLLSVGLSRYGGGEFSGRLAVPWFAFGFIAVAILHSFAPLPPALVAVAQEASLLVLAVAMAALGASTQLAAVRKAGLRPIAFAALLAVWLVVGGFALNLGLNAWLAPSL